MGPLAYQGLAVNLLTLAHTIDQFGAPASPEALQVFLGPAWRSTLAGDQPAGDTCAYYLSSANRAKRAFQLCFNHAQVLAATAVISTSGAGS